MKFRSVVGGDLRIVWQEISDAQAAKTVATFETDIDILIGRYLSPTSYFNQLQGGQDSCYFRNGH